MPIGLQSAAEGFFALFAGGFLVLKGRPPIGPGYGEARGRIIDKTYVVRPAVEGTIDTTKFLVEFEVDGQTYTAEYEASSWGDRYAPGDYAVIKYRRDDKSKIYMSDFVPVQITIFALMLLMGVMAYRHSLPS